MARPATSTTTVTTAVPALSLEATTSTAHVETATAASGPPVTDAPTTTAASPGSFTVSPATGPGGAPVTAAGNGCLQNGSGAGLSFKLTYDDPTGTGYGGDGGMVAADGTWSAPASGGRAGVPGRYRIQAQCLDAAYRVLFEYADAFYDATG